MSDFVDAPGSSVGTADFVQFLKGLPWCKQENNTLVAVYKLSDEVIELVRENEVKIFPGGMTVKLPRSVLMGLQKHSDEGQPLPAVLVWKPEHLEIWFRRQKSSDFPYDTWTDPSALAIEREKAVVPADKIGADSVAAHSDVLSRANSCPAMIPPY